MIKQTLLKKIEKIVKKIILEKYKLNVKKIIVDKAKNIDNGDFFTNAAMIVSGILKKPITEIGEYLTKTLKKDELFKDVKLLNGFINFILSDKAKFVVISQASKEQKEYGQFAPKKL